MTWAGLAHLLLRAMILVAQGGNDISLMNDAALHLSGGVAIVPNEIGQELRKPCGGRA